MSVSVDFARLDVPPTWRRVHVPDALDRRRFHVGKISRSDYLEMGAFPVIDQGREFIAGYWNDGADVYSGPLPVIVFGDHTRALKLVDFPFVCGADGTRVLVPNRELIDPAFLYYALSAIDVPSRGYNRHFRMLKEKAVPIPPMPEQRAIVHVLRTVQQAREATKRVIAAAQELKQSLARHVFLFGPVAPTETEPATWARTLLEDLVQEDRPIRYGILKPGPDVEGGIPYVKVRDYPDGVVDLGSLKRTSVEIAHQYRRASLRAGDILVSIRGTTGRVARVPDELEGGNITQDTARVSPSDAVDREYLTQFLRTEEAQTFIASWTKGAAVRGINLRELRQLPVPVPPLDVQIRIRDVLGGVDRKIAAEEGRLDALATLFDSLLKDLMTGRLRVVDLEIPT